RKRRVAPTLALDLQNEIRTRFKVKRLHIFIQLSQTLVMNLLGITVEEQLPVVLRLALVINHQNVTDESSLTSLLPNLLLQGVIARVPQFSIVVHDRVTFILAKCAPAILKVLAAGTIEDMPV